MNIRAVLWDFGGVLVRTEDASGRERLALKLGTTRHELENLVFSSDSSRQTQLGELSDWQHWQNVAAMLNLDPAELKPFQRDFWSGDRLDGQLIDLIRSLRPKYKTGLLSNNFPSLRKLLREHWKIEDAFDGIVISAEVGLLKPDPRIYHLALEQLGISPGEAVFVDDFRYNLAGAQAVGIHTIHFMNSQQAQMDLNLLLDGDD